MHGEEKRFAHVVLFECPWCLRLLSSAFLTFDEQLTDQLNELDWTIPRLRCARADG